MYDYKVGDKFKWKKNKCTIEDYSRDIYELTQRKNGEYYVKTIYSWYNDYDDWADNNSYEDICKRINEYLEKIED